VCVCVVEGRLDEVDRCLVRGVDVNYHHPDTGVTPLMSAAEEVNFLSQM